MCQSENEAYKIPVDLSYLMYVQEDKLEFFVNKLVEKYHIPASVIWPEVRKVWVGQPKMSEEDQKFWKDYYAEEEKCDKELDEYDKYLDQAEEDSRRENELVDQLTDALREVERHEDFFDNPNNFYSIIKD